MGLFLRDLVGRPRLVRALAPACVALAALALSGTAAGARGEPLDTALIEHEELSTPEADLALARARDAGLTAYRVILRWYDVAPAERPDGFDPENPADPAYRWDAFDLKIRRLHAYGLEPLVTVNYPPTWAGGGLFATPDAVEFGRFLKAAARRYSGNFQGLPRVRNWMIWNEPNVFIFFSPQFDEAERLIAPAAYRRLVNEGAAAVKSVHQDNVVVAGALSPFGVPSGYTRTIAPLRFMRDLLCVSSSTPATATCNERTAFDVWAVHPYTRGGPHRQASHPEDASIGDLPETRAILDAAARVGHIATNQKLRMWATEFSWDTNPPDPKAAPVRLQTRWTAEALYRMWKAGVSLVTWLQLRDYPYPASDTQAGLYLRGGTSLQCDRPKLTLEAYRFPFVAFKQGKSVAVWGRTPRGAPGKVVVEQLNGKKWAKVASLSTDRFGIFERTLKPKLKRGTFTDDFSYTRRYRELVRCDGATGYWRLGERSGAAAKDEINGGSGTYAAVSLASPGALSADNDPSATFSGGDSSVALGAIYSPRTVELWLRTTATNAVAFSNRNDASHYVYVGTSSTGRAFVFDTAALESTRPVNDGRWHHVVYTHDGTTGRLYVDGALDASAAWERAEGGSPATLGYDVALGNRFAGSLDEVAIYDVPLTADQVRAHYGAASRDIRVVERAQVKGTYLRARLLRSKAVARPFSLARPPDVTYEPFG